MSGVNPGDCVFFKQFKMASARKSPTLELKGHGFGIFLGHVPPFQKDPPAAHLIRLMGNVGYVSFDDIGEFLGEDQAKIAIRKFEEKHMGIVASPPCSHGKSDPALCDECIKARGVAQVAAEEAFKKAADSSVAMPPEREAPKLVNIHGRPIVPETPGETV